METQGLFNFNWANLLSASMVLFAVIDIIGSIPIFIILKKRSGHINALRATLVSLAIMVLFLYLGDFILKLLGVDISSFAIAGSIVIFIIAIEMLLGITIFKDELPQTASIVPIAFPMVAGTGTMTTLLSLRSEYSTIVILLAIVINLFVVYVVLRNLYRIEHVLGAAGISVLRKVFGIILLAIAIKLFRTNAGI